MEKTFCDICGKATDYLKLKLPRPFYHNSLKREACFYNGHQINFDIKDLDLCEDCTEKICGFITRLNRTYFYKIQQEGTDRYEEII